MQNHILLIWFTIAISVLPTTLSALQCVATATESSIDHRENFTMEILTEPFPYSFPKLGNDSSQLFPMPLCNGFQLEEATIDEMQIALSSGQLTSMQLLNCYLDRIHQVDKYLRYGYITVLT